LTRIEQEGHFGIVNRFMGITELKWSSGLRVYTAEIKPAIFVLLGGNKNGQEKDIKRAKKILDQIVSSRS
jgi:putative addiction module killer protein